MAKRMTVLGGYDLDERGVIIRRQILLTTGKDFGADPVGDGTYKMVPSGDIVDFDERTRRLNLAK